MMSAENRRAGGGEAPEERVLADWRGELRIRLPRAALYLLVAVAFYILSAIVPGLVAGVKLPGVLEPFGRLDWLLWAFLLLIALAFGGNAVYNLVRALDPLLEAMARRMGGNVRPAKRVARDVAYMLLVVLVAEALTPIAESLGGPGQPLKVVIGVTTLILLLILVYDVGKVTYRYIESKVELLIKRLEKVV
ncbi:MAG: hypothetical protein DRJ96_04460 [Thermoprotei archaeon]|nr:MAG: hypothetical protein DRJ96_04460 [Thermoprotei archaeon]